VVKYNKTEVRDLVRGTIKDFNLSTPGICFMELNKLINENVIKLTLNDTKDVVLYNDKVLSTEYMMIYI
jgi:hypothetical protein